MAVFGDDLRRLTITCSSSQSNIYTGTAQNCPISPPRFSCRRRPHAPPTPQLAPFLWSGFSALQGSTFTPGLTKNSFSLKLRILERGAISNHTRANSLKGLPNMETQSQIGKTLSAAMVTDAHSDYALHMLMEERKGDEAVFVREHLPRLRAAGVRLEVNTVGGDFGIDQTDFRTPLTVLAVLDSVHRLLAREPHQLLLIRTVADLEALEQGNKIGILLALEGTMAVDPEFSLLRNYYRLGLRSVILTHNERNIFAEGCGEKSNGGLSELGRKLLEEVNRTKLMLDLVHVAERTFHEALELFARIPVVSHSNARALCNHFRNLTDGQIKAIASRGGVIGMNFFGAIVDSDPKKANLERMIDHIAYIGDLVGIDHVGLGPDFGDYYMDALLRWIDRHGVRLGMSRDSVKYATGIEDVSTLPRIAPAMLARGFSDSDIAKVLGGNFFRVYKSNLANSPTSG